MIKKLLTIVAIGLVGSTFALNPPEESTLKWIKAVDFSHVKIEDGFWSPRLDKHRSATLPVCIDQIENKTGRMRNFENAGKGTGGHSGIFFDDSDVYKAIEGIAYSLKNYPNEELEKKADEWIAKIASAQQPDGYINTFYTLTGLDKRWSDMDKHEMYCAGHLIEAGVAYYQATGKRVLLDVGQRMADHMMTLFGPDKRHWVPGHEEIELALVKLAGVTKENKYIDFANWLIEERGHGHGSYGDSRKWNGVYYQDDKPVREMTDIAGHAVRCMYLYCGVADVAALKHDEGYMETLDRLWNDVVLKNMYITGGIGSSHHNEGFTVDYDLPNKEAYCETCASVGMVLWNERMNQFTGDAKYIDVLERSMYNGALAGISISGDRFFYVNPLESDGNHHRKEWYGCACCPSQVSRFLPSIGNYVYDISDNAVWVNLYMGNKATIAIDGNDVTLNQKTGYPWSGGVDITVATEKSFKRELRLRIPGWCKKYGIKVNGKKVRATVEKGYAVIKRTWKNGDKITFNMDMPVEVVAADARVKANVGKRAIQRGPIVYCLEEADNGGAYANAHLMPQSAFSTKFEPELLGGVQTISLTTDGSTWKLIPYYAWDNRQAGRMKVWLDYKAGIYTNNRMPLLQKSYMELPLGSIKAEGWLADQLGRMRDGMTGHMDSIYNKVMGARNGWLGGDGDVWERGPYWIDGLLPLAYILDDEALKAKVQPWIEWTLASQKPNGYFGPDTDRPHERGLQRNNSHDWWPKMVMLKVMQQYYSATGDKRVIPFFTNYFRYQLAELPKTPLGNWTYWGQQRGGDNLMMVYWLYNITGDSFLLDLASLIHKQTTDWTDIFLNRDHLYRPHSLHCVNLGQGFKEPAVYYQQSRDRKHLLALDKAVEKMRHTIALPTGLWGGDELLRFGAPTTGSELCTATEMMFSLEEILEITGDVKWADRLERIAYNVLPAQITDDFSARQYYQQTNQVCVTREWREFSTPHDDTDILFGELTGYPCCTSNLHQGWPKLTQNLWYATADEGVAALVYAPSSMTAKVAGGVEVCIKESTDYPFNEAINFNISFAEKKLKATFPIHLRIPEWCKGASIEVNGEAVEADTRAGNIAIVSREWRCGDKMILRLPMDVAVSRWYDRGAVVERGPLLYALKMEEKWEKKEMEPEKQEDYGKWYYEVTSSTPWNYALSRKVIDPKNLKESFNVETRSLDGKYPWNVENAPISIKVNALRLNNWTIVRGSAGPVSFYTQQGRDYSGEEVIELIPYGCTTLRIAEFPVR